MTEDQKAIQVDDKDSMIRQNLVDTAVNFLQNADVINKPETSKAAFLKNKGLNDAEIALAFDRVKPISNQNFSVPPPLPYPQKTYSFWSQLSRFSSSFLVVAVALYGLHHFYKLYIEPWLFGKKSETCQLSIMEEQLIELNNSIKQLSSTVSTLEKSVNAHKQRVDSVIDASGIVLASVAVSSLKTEIGNVKSLLINRHQFPAVPKVATPSLPSGSKVASPSIPHWQLQSTEDEAVSEKDGDSLTESSVKNEIDELLAGTSSVPVSTIDSNGIENGINGTHSADELSNHKNESLDSSSKDA